MNIIFGDAVQHLPDSFTILELDSFDIDHTGITQKAWAVIENVPLHEFATLTDYRSAHENLLSEYRQQNWTYCLSAIRSLMGRWNGDLDSFYQHLKQRILDYQQNPPAADWNGAIVRQAIGSELHNNV